MRGRATQSSIATSSSTTATPKRPAGASQDSSSRTASRRNCASDGRVAGGVPQFRIRLDGDSLCLRGRIPDRERR